jgi:hypothetical protein
MWVALALALIALISLARSGTGPPPLRKSCTTPAFRLAASTLVSDADVGYSVVGPDDAHFVFGIDVGSLRSGEVGLEPVPKPGAGAASARLISDVFGMVNCRHTGHLTPHVATGGHEVELFRTDGVGASPVPPAVTTMVDVPKR